MTTVRQAKISDAKNLAALAEAIFRDTFSDQNTPEDINLYCASSFGEAIQQDEISNPQYVTLVVENQNQLIAFAQLRWGPAPNCIVASSAGEIQRLYIDKAWQGKGIAQLLMSTCLKIMQAHKIDVAWLGVWEENPRAISFYREKPGAESNTF